MRARATPSALPARPGAPRRREAHLSLAGTLALAEPQAPLWLALELLSGEAARQLTPLARLAQRFSSCVSLEPPDAVLLEVRGSLGLFGGVTGLAAALGAACTEAGLPVHVAFAPTPLAALAVARAGGGTVLAPAQLTGALAPLPLTVLRWPPPVLERLKRAGVRTLGAVLRLPRAGFARRFGLAQLAALDRLTGRLHEVRAPFKPRERFRRRQELSCEADAHPQLLGPLKRLLRELEDFLKVRQAGVMALECRLLHRERRATACHLALAAPAAEGGHLAALFAAQLARLELTEPVRALELRAPVLLAREPESGGLWQPGEHGGRAGDEAHALIERLRARLGTEAIHGLTLLEDHRPENAWALAPPPAARGTARRPGAAAVLPRASRPLWLLAAPQPLCVRGGRPRRRGALELVSEPERIESGWWDGEDVARDYYTARDAHGVRLWVFRERHAPHGWYLHGIFG